MQVQSFKNRLLKFEVVVKSSQTETKKQCLLVTVFKIDFIEMLL